MDQVTQQNAALVEQAAAATEAMQEQARNLAEVVSVFKLSHEGANLPAATAVPRQVPAPQANKPTPPVAAIRTAAAPAPLRRTSGRPATSGDDWEEF